MKATRRPAMRPTRTGADGVPNTVSPSSVSTDSIAASLYRPVPPMIARSMAKGIDAWQVAALLVVVHAIAIDVAIGYFQRDVIGVDAFHATVMVLDPHHRDADVRGALVFAPVAHGLQSVSLIEDVIGDDHAATFQRRGRAMQPSQAGAG